MASSTSPQHPTAVANPHALGSTSTSPPPKVAKTRNRVINSCLMCRKRKVRCDRTMPTCLTCLRGNHNCTYEDRAIKNMKAKEEAGLGALGGKSNLNERIQRLEKLVAEATRLARLTTTDGLGGEKSIAQQLVEDMNLGGDLEEATRNLSGKNERIQENGISRKLAEDLNAAEKDRGKGTLILEDDGNARFVSPLYWALLEEEVQEIQNLNEESPASQDTISDSPENSALSPNSNEEFDAMSSMVFGTTFQLDDLILLYPPSYQTAMNLYNLFLVNVDPMCGIIHPPTMTVKFSNYMEGRYNFTVQPSKTFEPLAFAIMFGAVRSMSADECEVEFGEPLPIVMARFKRGLELALAKADFLCSGSLDVLMAFVLLLTFLCREDDIGRVWSLSGLAFRIAQSLGLHREPTLFPSQNMDVVQVELRRRLWHQICLLDFRTAEGTGQQPTITEEMFDTLMPSNVNNADLIEGTKPPSYEDAVKNQDKEGFTDMTLQLLRYNYMKCYRKLIRSVYPVDLQNQPVPSRIGASGEKSMSELEKDMTKVFEEMRDKNHRLYLNHCGVVNLMERCALGLGHVLEWKYWIMFYHRFSVQYREKAMSMELRKEICIKSILLIESLNLVTKDKTVDKFRWHMDSHVAFHSIRHALTEITSPGFQGPELKSMRERGWAAIEEIVETQKDKVSRDWAILRRMVNHARRTAGRAASVDSGIGASTPEGSIQRIDDLMRTVAPEEFWKNADLSKAEKERLWSMEITKEQKERFVESYQPRPEPPPQPMEDTLFGLSTDIDMIGSGESPFGFIPFTNPLNDGIGFGLWDQWDLSSFQQRT